MFKANIIAVSVAEFIPKPLTTLQEHYDAGAFESAICSASFYELQDIYQDAFTPLVSR